MKITIVGAGNVGSTIAADLALKGHEISLVKTSNRIHNEHFEYIRATQNIIIEECGIERKAKISCITTNIKEAITAETELIVICVQSNFHEQIIKKIVPFLHDGQIVLFEPGYLSTAFLFNLTNKRIISVEAESSPIDSRITHPGCCCVLFKNVRNPIGIYPMEDSESALEKLSTLGYNFKLLTSVVEAALHNPNLIIHTVGAIMSIPRIEYTNGNYWMYKEVFTPKVLNLLKKLDAEKMSILNALRFKPIKYFDACKYRNFLDETINAEDAFFDYANNHSPKGPLTADSRYITEDVSQGLCLLESLGKFLGINTPIATSLIDFAGALLDTDLRLKGRDIQKFNKPLICKILNIKN